MTTPHRSGDERACGGDVAAYALGALDPAEREAFRRHLESCAVCRDELAAFEQVADLLPLSVPPLRAPASLRRRVLDAVAAEPRPPSRAGGRAPISTSADAERMRPATGAGASGRRRPWRVLARRPRPALGAAAVLATAVLALVIVGLSSTSSPTTRVIRADVVGRGSAELQLSGDRGELVVRDFAPPPAGQIYEVWLERPGREPAPTGALFSVTAAGDGNVGVPGDLRGVEQVLVTPEPAGGTTVPTHPPVISASLT
jgi:hypothetical protein